jgi:uncharacterized protein YjdB
MFCARGVSPFSRNETTGAKKEPTGAKKEPSGTFLSRINDSIIFAIISKESKEHIMRNTIKRLGGTKFAWMRILCIIAVIGFSMAACDDDNGPSGGYNPNPGSNVPVTGVTLNQTSLTLAVGGSATLVATVLPGNASNKNVAWDSSNTGVATVSNGTVTAIGAGQATITVTTLDGGRTATCSVTVTSGNPTPSINGTWGLSSGYRITISGSSGVINAIGSSDLMVDAASKGYIHVGDTVVRNLNSTGNLTWSGELMGITYTEDFLGNVEATGTGWRNTVFTLSSDGNTLSTSTSAFTTGSASTWTRQ